jgi:hypothetical protein
LSEDHSVLSAEAIDALKDVSIVGIELRRLAGRNATSQEVLAAIESTIAEYFVSHENSIICYYCDFINPIPHTKKNKMPPQEYRSKLFDVMFQRYAKHHGINNVRLSVVEINGTDEIYYFHVIYREIHSMLAALIGSDLKEGFGK